MDCNSWLRDLRKIESNNNKGMLNNETSRNALSGMTCDVSELIFFSTDDVYVIGENSYTY